MREAGLMFEICDIGSGVINGAVMFNGRRAGHIQFDMTKDGHRAIRRLRRHGFRVRFPTGLRPMKKTKRR